ncbi:P-loop NTPase [Candidatus Woesearchaeota archaeon]|nr:P-loop NTPase [Candidatus Woesearchaeota archaeon]
MTKFIGVMCAKGGVGRTQVTINLAHALQHIGYNVLVLDCDFSSPNIPIYLGLLGTKNTIHSILKGEAKLNEVITLHESGLRCIVGSIAYHDATISDVDLLEKVLCEIEGFDIVMVDTSAGFQSSTSNLMKLMDNVLLVTAPELTAATDCLRTIKLARDYKKNILGVVVNKWRGDALDMKPEAIESFLSTKVVGRIPYDNDIRNAVFLRQPVVYAFPDARSTIAFKKLASNLAGTTYHAEKAAPEELENISVKKTILKQTLHDFGLI